MLKDLLLTGEEVSILGAPLAAKVTFPVFNSQLKLKSKQAMITLQGMAEHRLSNVYNYQRLIWILIFTPHSLSLLFAVHFPKTRCMNCVLSWLIILDRTYKLTSLD